MWISTKNLLNKQKYRRLYENYIGRHLYLVRREPSSSCIFNPDYYQVQLPGVSTRLTLLYEGKMVSILAGLRTWIGGDWSIPIYFKVGNGEDIGIVHCNLIVSSNKLVFISILLPSDSHASKVTRLLLREFGLQVTHTRGTTSISSTVYNLVKPGVLSCFKLGVYAMIPVFHTSFEVQASGLVPNNLGYIYDTTMGIIRAVPEACTSRDHMANDTDQSIARRIIDQLPPPQTFQSQFQSQVMTQGYLNPTERFGFNTSIIGSTILNPSTVGASINLSDI